MSMYFVKEGGIGKISSPANTQASQEVWPEAKLRTELQQRGVWVSSLPGNVENWYPQVLGHVRDGSFTFAEFADTFAEQQPFDFSKAIQQLLYPPETRAGGWLEGLMD
jgi:hypothetical protein